MKSILLSLILLSFYAQNLHSADRSSRRTGNSGTARSCEGSRVAVSSGADGKLMIKVISRNLTQTTTPDPSNGNTAMCTLEIGKDELREVVQQIAEAAGTTSEDLKVHSHEAEAEAESARQ